MGAALIRKLSAAGLDVRFANNRGPDTVQDLARETGSRNRSTRSPRW
jgi:predicted dinucleotide-binding enzyme